jgi:hypothetical protein
MAVYESQKAANLQLSAFNLPLFGGKAAVAQLSAPLKR